MSETYNILVTGVGGPTPRSFVRSVLHSGCDRYRFVGVDANPLAIGLYDKESYISTYVVPRVDEQGYWRSIRQIVKEHDIALAVVMPEVELLAWAEAAQSNNLPCRILLSSHQALSTLVDKNKLHDALCFKPYLPRHHVFDNGTDISDVPLPYPFWVRATLGSSGLGSLKVSNSMELAEWMRINPDIETFIATEYLPGRNLACKLLYHDGKLLRSACAERVEYIMAKVSPSGITGNTSFGRLINDTCLVEIAHDAIHEILQHHGDKPNGIFTADFKESAEGEPKITEINIRCVAFVSAMAQAGANIPLDYLNLNLNPEAMSCEYRHYTFPDNTIFLRDVDERPLVMKEHELLTRGIVNE